MIFARSPFTILCMVERRIFNVLKKAAQGSMATVVSFLPMTPCTSVSQAALRQLVVPQSHVVEGSMSSLSGQYDYLNISAEVNRVRPGTGEGPIPDPDLRFERGDEMDAEVVIKENGVLPPDAIQRVNIEGQVSSDTVKFKVCPRFEYYNCSTGGVFTALLENQDVHLLGQNNLYYMFNLWSRLTAQSGFGSASLYITVTNSLNSDPIKSMNLNLWVEQGLPPVAFLPTVPYGHIDRLGGW